MNNKILARIVALVLAVMMLGTVSFATTTDIYTGNADKYALATTKTVLAYAVTAESEDAAKAISPTAVGAEIIAVVQEKAITTIPVDNDKLEGKDYIVVISGGDDAAATKTFAIKIDDGVEYTLLEVAKEVTIGNTEYTNVAYLSQKFTVPAGKTAPAGSYGIKFNSYASADATTPINEETAITVPGKVRVGDGTEVVFHAVVVAVPYNTIDPTHVIMGQFYIDETQFTDTAN